MTLHPYLHCFSPLRTPLRRNGLSVGPGAVVKFLRGSRALASMLPSFVASGAMTLVVSAMMRMVPVGPQLGFLHGWMTDWLITWALGFPLAYVAQMSMAWLFTGVSAGTVEVETDLGRKHDLTVQRAAESRA